MNGYLDRGLDRNVAELPRSIRPERDLWTGIERRIAERRVVALRAPSSLRARRRKLAVASAAALAAAAALTLLVEGKDHRPPGLSPVPSAVAVSSPPPAVLAPAEGAIEHAEERSTYHAAVRALEVSLAESRSHLSSQDAERLEQSLGVLDDAIQSTELALSRDPDSAELQRQLWDEYQQKVDTLVVVMGLVGRAS